MADDVVFLNPGQAPFGRDGFSPGFSAAHQQARINCMSDLEDVVVVGEVAYTLSRDLLSVTPRAGGEAMQLGCNRALPWDYAAFRGAWPRTTAALAGLTTLTVGRECR